MVAQMPRPSGLEVNVLPLIGIPLEVKYGFYVHRRVDSLPKSDREAFELLYREGTLPEFYERIVVGSTSQAHFAATSIVTTVQADNMDDPVYLTGTIVCARDDRDAEAFVRAHEETHLAHQLAPVGLAARLRELGLADRVPPHGDHAMDEAIAHLGAIAHVVRTTGRFDPERLDGFIRSYLDGGVALAWDEALEWAVEKYAGSAKSVLERLRR